MPVHPIPKAASAMPAVMHGILRSVSPEQAALLAWPLACGGKLAVHAVAESFIDGTLSVRVADTSWKRELQRMEGRYISSLELLLPGVVKKLEFRI